MNSRVGLAIALICTLPVGSAAAAPVVIGIPLQNDDGVTTDLFDVSQGAVMTSSSPLYPGFNAQGTFGSTSPQAVEGFRTIFADSPFATDFIEFTTLSPVNLSSYRLVLGEDGNGSGNRSVSAFRLYASNSPGNVLSNLVSSASIAQTYTANYGSPQIAVTDTLNILSVKFFRMELDRTSSGPRVFELDGFGVVVPEPSSVTVSMIGLLVAGIYGWYKRRK